MRPSRVGDDSAEIRLLDGGLLTMTRGCEDAAFAFPSAPSAAELLHPYLAPAAALAQLWAGAEAIHAGAFAFAGGAFLLLAGKEGGKSTTLGFLAHQHGLPVLADDLAVITDGMVLPGPRCIDMRRPTGPDPWPVPAGDPPVLSGGQTVRAGERRRLTLPPAPTPLPVRGIVLLAWGDRVALTEPPAAERLRSLISQRMFRASVSADHHALLDIAALPTVRLERRRDADGLIGATSALLRYLA
jgi:hypothetical protein